MVERAEQRMRQTDGKKKGSLQPDELVKAGPSVVKGAPTFQDVSNFINDS